MDNILFRGRLQRMVFKSSYLFECVAVRRNSDAVEQVEHLVFVQDVRLFAGKILRGEHEVVGEAERLHDIFGGVHRIVKTGTVLAVGFHGVGIVHENGNYIALLDVLVAAAKVGLRKCQNETNNS